MFNPFYETVDSVYPLAVALRSVLAGGVVGFGAFPNRVAYFFAAAPGWRHFGGGLRAITSIVVLAGSNPQPGKIPLRSLTRSKELSRA